MNIDIKTSLVACKLSIFRHWECWNLDFEYIIIALIWRSSLNLISYNESNFILFYYILLLICLFNLYNLINFINFMFLFLTHLYYQTYII
jgi:hypothetical protein